MSTTPSLVRQFCLLRLTLVLREVIQPFRETAGLVSVGLSKSGPITHQEMRPSRAFAGILCVLALVTVTGWWIGFGLPEKGVPKGLTGSSAKGGASRPDSSATPSTNGRLTMLELAALALNEGVRLPKDQKPKSFKQPNSSGGAPSREETLLQQLETGSEAEASEAIRGLAALGGAVNHQRLGEIMKDEGWSDALRTDAALALLETGKAADARRAVRELAVIGGDANTGRLDGIVKDAALSKDLRLEAALGLGIIGTPRAADALIDAFATFSDPQTQEQLLEPLGRFPFPQIEATWREFLADPNTSNQLRVAAVDALSNSSPESLPFLKTLAASDRDPKVREMSAWAISVQGQNGSLGPELARMTTSEREPDVRRRLYEALLAQAANPAESLLPQIRNETDIAARMAGFNAVGDAVKRNATPGLTATFNAHIVPELTQVALSSESLNIRMRAVFALRRADTPAARQALLEISQTQTPQIASAASHGLKASK
jgi:HEAT repeat protein